MFGQATYELFDGFRALVGARQTEEKKTQDLSTRNPTGFPLVLGRDTLPSTNPPFRDTVQEVNFSELTWKAGFEWDVPPRSLIYANISTGFKSGGIDQTGDPFDPETLTAYTIGSKSRFFNNRLQLNLEAFHWNYKDQQVQVIVPVPPNFVNGAVVLNVGSARVTGVDADIVFAPTAQDTFNLGVQYLKSTYRDFVYNVSSPSGARPTTNCEASLAPTQVTPPPNRLYTINCSGRPTVNAPKWSLVAGYRRTVDLPNGYSVVVSVNSQYQSSRFLSIEYLPEVRQKAFITTDASLTLHEPEERWSLTAWINNIEDTVIKNNAFIRPILNVGYAGLRPPRTYGLRANFQF